jgi:hypothetical protein
VDKEQFNRVDGLDEVKEVWTTLWMAHEGWKPVRKAKIDMLEGQLNRFVIFDDETAQDMFNRLKKLVNKAKALGSKKWTDCILTKHMMRAYTSMNYNMVALIHQNPAYKRMSSDDVLGRNMNHEMYIEEANHVKNLSRGIITTRKQEIAFKANKKNKNKQVVVESSTEEEEEDSSECDAEDMALFMKKFKDIKKKMFSKGDKKFKSTTKRICYNCGKHGHFIANCPFERRDDDDDKKKSKPHKKDKGYKRSDKPYKKKSYIEAHIGQEWESNDENSNSDSDGVATIAIKGTSSSNKSLFPKLDKGKSTCLMAKESKRKVKTKGLSSPKYNSSDDDDDTPFPNGINEKGIIKRLEKELVARDQLLEDQEDLLEQERKSTCELKKLLNLEKEKNEELAQGKKIISSLEGLIGALQDSYDILKKTHKDLEVQFDALWVSTSKPSSTPKTTKASTSNGCERCYNIDIDALCTQSQHSNVEQVLVESCDEAIGKENDNLKLEVKRV